MRHCRLRRVPHCRLGPSCATNRDRPRRCEMIWLRTLLFTLLVPGTVLVLLPFALLRSRWGPRVDIGGAWVLGVVLLFTGVTVILRCFVEFIRRGRGTPAPYDPPRELVAAGPYRVVRNPQYVGVFLVAAGEGLMSGALILFG